MSFIDTKAFFKQNFAQAVIYVLAYSLFVAFAYLAGYYGSFKFNVLPFLSFWDVVSLTLFTLCELVLRLLALGLVVFVGYSIYKMYKYRMKFSSLRDITDKFNYQRLFQVLVVILIAYPFVSFYYGAEDAKEIYNNNSYYMSAVSSKELKWIGYASGHYFFVGADNKSMKIIHEPHEINLLRKHQNRPSYISP